MYRGRVRRPPGASGNPVRWRVPGQWGWRQRIGRRGRESGVMAGVTAGQLIGQCPEGAAGNELIGGAMVVGQEAGS